MKEAAEWEGEKQADEALQCSLTDTDAVKTMPVVLHTKTQRGGSSKQDR